MLSTAGREMSENWRIGSNRAEGRNVSSANLELKDPVFVDGDSRTLRVARDFREKELVRFVLEKTDGNVSKAAVEFGDQPSHSLSVALPIWVKVAKFINVLK